jgi:hypothetical protein
MEEDGNYESDPFTNMFLQVNEKNEIAANGGNHGSGELRSRF